jgi:anti-sigma factor RsiW
VTTPEELDCDYVVEIVTDYLEDALDPVARAAFEAHLDECDDCVTYLEQIRTTARAVGEVGGDHLSESTRAGLLAAFKDLRRDAS